MPITDGDKDTAYRTVRMADATRSGIEADEHLSKLSLPTALHLLLFVWKRMPVAERRNVLTLYRQTHPWTASRRSKSRRSD